MPAVNIIVLGPKGRMGQMVLSACAKILQKNPTALKVVGAISSPNSSTIGQSVGVEGLDLKISGDLEAVLTPNSVIIDFTSPQTSLQTLALAEKKGAGVVLCTTGFTDAEKEIIQATAKKIPIVFSPNMSIGVNLMFKITEMVALALGDDFDAEIIEAHHNQKKDSPSGTAFGFAEAIARGRNIKLSEKTNYGREGLVGARPRGEIGIHAVRGGDIVGDHTILFAGDGERIELKHMAHSRQTFAQGAVKAALFLKDKGPGIYSMSNVLGL